MRVLIVDDEPLARGKIRELLEGDPEVQIAGECADGHSALTMIRESAPDAVFLDVQMPEMDGFGVVRAVGAQKMPVVVFVTAFDHYALEAFDACALDYLLKPFDRERFVKALARAKKEVKKREESRVSEQIGQLLARLDDRSRHIERLVIRAGGRVFFLRLDEVDWIEAAGNYVRLHTAGEEHLHRETITRMEQQLDPGRFARIHRGVIVNLSRIKELKPLFRGEYEVVLKNGRTLTLSRSYRGRLGV